MILPGEKYNGTLKSQWLFHQWPSNSVEVSRDLIIWEAPWFYGLFCAHPFWDAFPCPQVPRSRLLYEVDPNADFITGGTTLITFQM